MTAQPSGRSPALDPAPLRVVMVEDHAMIVEMLAQFLETVQDGERPIRMVAHAGSLREAVRVLGETQAHVVIVDVNLPDGSGLNLVKQIRARSATIGLVVLTMMEDDGTVIAARDAGASALVLKSEGAAKVLAAVRHATQTPREFIAHNLDDALLRRESLPRLSPRELEVLELLADGHKVSGVSQSLFMSESTVKTHIGKVYDKLGVHNRAGAIMRAIELGLIRPHKH